MQGEIEVTLSVQYGDLFLQTKRKTVSGNPLYAPRVVRLQLRDAEEEIISMLSSVSGDIDKGYGA